MTSKLVSEEFALLFQVMFIAIVYTMSRLTSATGNQPHNLIDAQLAIKLYFLIEREPFFKILFTFSIDRYVIIKFNSNSKEIFKKFVITGTRKKSNKSDDFFFLPATF